MRIGAYLRRMLAVVRPSQTAKPTRREGVEGAPDQCGFTMQPILERVPGSRRIHERDLPLAVDRFGSDTSVAVVLGLQQHLDVSAILQSGFPRQTGTRFPPNSLWLLCSRPQR